MKDKKVRKPNCWICKDKGFITYFKEENGQEYEMFAKCRCRASIPYQAVDVQVTDQIAEWMAKRNLEAWLEQHPKEQEGYSEVS
jgi:hypothetical protein